MNAILVKLFATALTLSQVTTRPDAVRTQFDPVSDRAEVQKILRDGCAHMRRAFDIEDLNLDELIATAMEDPQAVAGNTKILQGLDLRDLHGAYREFCKNETVTPSPADLAEVIAYYNKAAADLPDHAKLKGGKLPGASLILDGRGERFAEIYEPDNRRLWVPLSDVPESLRKAFVAAEDKRFFQHKGIDERGVIRAFIGNLAKPGRPQGGSTITQQVAKNLLVGDDVTYERKIREMIVASRLERTLTKDEILELYLNTIYLGRASWGVEMAARSWFGKSVKALTLEEGALLAGLPKGPNFYSPDRFPERAQERLAYVLSRMKEDGALGEDEMRRAIAAKPRLAAFDRPRRDLGLHFVDHLGREAKTFAGVDGLTASSYVVRSTIDTALQRSTEAALQEGLARYELSTGRMRFEGPEANLSETIKRLESTPEPKTDGIAKPLWLQALERARLPLYDVHWPAAVVVDKGKTGEMIRVGLADGRVLALNAFSAAIRRSLKLHDVVRVRVVETKGQGNQRSARAELRVRPTVQGAAVVLENRTGRILAMSGGFSYPLSQLNRATQAHRQPGSTLKPLTYLAALAKGLQPNTLVWDTPVTLPPVGGHSTRPQDYWSPRNYDRGSAGLVTLRRALENSKNLVTARLLDGAIDRDPEKSLSRVCELAMEAQLYLECERYYPFVLGAQPVRLIDLAAFYAAIANEGARPTPYALEGVEEGGRTLYAHADQPPVRLGSADRVAFYQVKTMLQGVVERGTAASIRRYAPYVAGKTGTTDKEGDAWFVGFTNDVTVAVWVGYDNADGKRKTLGSGQTGAKVAIPIFSAIIEAAWAGGVPKVALSPPSEEARRLIADLPIDLRTGDPALDRRFAFVEHFRRGPDGRIDETQYRLVPQGEAYAARDPYGDGDDSAGLWGDGRTDRDPYARRGPYAQAPSPWWRDDPGMRQPQQPQQPGWWRQPTPSPWWDDEDPRQRRSRRIDPDYLWQRQIY
ncbi:MAG TPA: transglycosylase domain-containing protein [Beijerinckiaceae bacterium]|jgi:membrane carboxypeptidase/penicillin-binding protein